MALAGLLEKTGDAGSAVEELRQALKQEQKNAAIYERIGDLEAGRNHNAEARAAYESAIQNAPDSQTAKRIRKKLK